MSGREPRSGRFRAVILSRDPTVGSLLGRCCAPGVRLLRVASGYEAAAEILAAPVAALVVDFRAMARPHRKLLDLARRMGVELLGVGRLPTGMSIDDLSCVRLVSRADLPAALDAVAAAAAPDAGELVAPPTERPPEDPAAVEREDSGASRLRAGRAKKAAPRRSPKKARESADKPAEGARPAVERAPQAPPVRPEPAQPAATEPPAAALATAPAQPPEPAPAEPPSAEARPVEPASEPARRAAPPTAPAVAMPSELLTPEEIAALLENGS
jgi:hypothetical protein